MVGNFLVGESPGQVCCSRTVKKENRSCASTNSGVGNPGSQGWRLPPAVLTGGKGEEAQQLRSRSVQPRLPNRHSPDFYLFEHRFLCASNLTAHLILQSRKDHLEHAIGVNKIHSSGMLLDAQCIRHAGTVELCFLISYSFSPATCTRLRS